MSDRGIQQPHKATGGNRLEINSVCQKLALQVAGGSGNNNDTPRRQAFVRPLQMNEAEATVTKKLKRCNLSPKKSTVDQPATAFVKAEKVLCSMFLIRIESGRRAYRYDVDIVVKSGAGKAKSLTKGSDDGQRALNRNLCYELLTTAYAKTGQFGMPQGSQLVYDCKSVLYSSCPIKLRQSVIALSSSEVYDYVKTYCSNSSNFTVSITRNQASPVLEIDNLAQYQTNNNRSKLAPFREDRSARTFLEMAISQFSINNNIYSTVGAGKLFETSAERDEPVENGIVLRSGVVKGVRICENYGDPTPALVLDAKTSPFFQPQGLLKTIMALINGKNFPQTSQDWNRIRAFIANLRVKVAYSTRTFAIGKFTDKPLSRLRMLYEGQEVSMPTFFELRHGLKLAYPDFPGVIPNTPVPKGRCPEVFPIEQLVIMEDQRVPLEKMHKKLSNQLLKVNSLPPSERATKIMEHAKKMGVFSLRNPVLSAFGITIEKNTNQVDAGVRRCPQISYANNQMVKVDAEKAKWPNQIRDAKFVQTMEIDRWAVVCAKQDHQTVQKFIKKFLPTAEKSGMIFLSPPIYVTFNRQEVGEEWPTKFEKFVEKHKNVEFIFLFDDDPENNSHNLLKYYEARHKVLTQHITLRIAQGVVEKEGRNEVLMNILQKANCKNFGLNYIPVMEDSAARRFDLAANGTLVVAYDVAHPPPISQNERRILRTKGLNVDSMDPSVVGICSNMAVNPNAFVGDYFYQESRKEQVNSAELRDRISWILSTLQLNRGVANARPPHVLILRDGLSEGQALMAYDDELSAIRQGFRDLDPNYSPKITFVIGTKRHYKKFFAVREDRIENLAPGTVVTQKFTRCDLPEFFLQSHYPIRGVGKPVEYTVICDEIAVSQDELQGLLNGLCYSHQIVTSAISLPEPVYQADELAKRGFNNFLVMKTLHPTTLPRLPNGLVDTAALSRLLSYRYDKKNLVSTRFTA